MFPNRNAFTSTHCGWHFLRFSTILLKGWFPFISAHTTKPSPCLASALIVSSKSFQGSVSWQWSCVSVKTPVLPAPSSTHHPPPSPPRPFPPRHAPPPHLPLTLFILPPHP